MACLLTHVGAWVPATSPTAPSFLLILGSMQVLTLHCVASSCSTIFMCWSFYLNAIPPSPHQTPAHVSSWSSQGLHSFKSLSWPHHLPSTSVMFDVPVGMQLKLITEWTVISLSTEMTPKEIFGWGTEFSIESPLISALLTKTKESSCPKALYYRM